MMKILSGSSGISLHFEKHKGGNHEIDGLARHDERQPGGNHSNENIDDNHTADNVILKSSDKRLSERIADTIEANRDGGLKGVRKDAVRYVEATVQLSGVILGQSEAEQEETLRNSYNWLNERFGAENVVSASIHKDETNMHLHLGFVPITEDTNKKGETKRVLSAKKVISKENLRIYQNDFLTYIQEKEPRMNFRRGGGLNGLSQAQFEEFSKRQKSKDEDIERQQDALDFREDSLDDREEKLDKLEKKIDEKNSDLSSRLDIFDHNVTKLAKREEKVESDEFDLRRRENKLIEDRRKLEEERRQQDAIKSKILTQLTGEKEDWEEAKRRAQEALDAKNQDIQMNLRAAVERREILDAKIKAQNERSKRLDERESSLALRESNVNEKAKNADRIMSNFSVLKKRVDEQTRNNHQEILDAIRKADASERESIRERSTQDTIQNLKDSNKLFDFDLDDLNGEQHGPQQ